MLEDSDAEAIDVVHEIAAGMGQSASRERIKAIGQHIDDFEFDEALELLAALREIMTSSASDSAKLA